MSDAVDIAIIGGGIVGASTAWALAARQAGSIAVFERSVIAAGASGKTGAFAPPALLERTRSTTSPSRSIDLPGLVNACGW
ncbi:MAG: FAD-dependent oxidoreductase [Thermomicrobiales bacterium]